MKDWLFTIVLLVTTLFFPILRRNFKKSYLHTYQAIVNKYGIMTIQTLENTIVKQYYYFLYRNKKTPLIIKYNFLLTVTLYIFLTKKSIFELEINFLTVVASFFFLFTMTLCIIESYMYFHVSQMYTDLFWEEYISTHKKNELKVIIHYAYTPRESTRVILIWYLTFLFLIILIYSNFFVKEFLM